MGRRGRYLIGIAFLALVLFTACGGEPKPAEGSQRSLPISTCVAATVSLGKASGSIEFSVRCRAKARGATVGFSVSRAGLHGFSRHPSVTGPGAERRFGSCVRRRNRPIECQAKIDGRARIAGKITVAPAGRCTVPVSITVSETTGCSGKVCPADYVTRQIFSGRPRGC